jgi:hypothetical protein
MATVDTKQSQSLDARLARVEKILRVGKEDHFIAAWGRLMFYAVQSRWTVLLMGIALICLAGSTSLMAYRWNTRETVLLIKDGDRVYPANMADVVKASSNRDTGEVTGFVRRWVKDAYEFNPLDWKNKVRGALRSVDTQAQNIAMHAMDLEERARLVEQGTSVRVVDDLESGKAPSVSLVSTEPLQVSVVFQRVGITSNKEIRDLAPKVCTVTLRLIPRSTINPGGLMITDISATTH